MEDFIPGEIYRHKLTKEKLLFLKTDGSCYPPFKFRTTEYSVIYFNSFEVEENI